MAKTKDKTPPEPSSNSRPAIDPEARQNQLIALAVLHPSTAEPIRKNHACLTDIE